AFGLGFIVGPAIGGLLATNFGYAVPAFVAAFFALCSTSLTTFYLKEPQHARDTTAVRGLKIYTRVFEYFHEKNLRLLLAIFLFFALPFSLWVSMFSLFAMIELKFTPQEIGFFMMYVGLIGILWQGVVIRPMVRKIGEVASLRIGLM